MSNCLSLHKDLFLTVYKFGRNVQQNESSSRETTSRNKFCSTWKDMFLLKGPETFQMTPCNK